MKIDKSKLGIVGYSESIADKLKEKYAGKTIIGVSYNYFVEEFYLVLDDGTELCFSEPQDDY